MNDIRTTARDRAGLAAALVPALAGALLAGCASTQTPLPGEDGTAANGATFPAASQSGVVQGGTPPAGTGPAGAAAGPGLAARGGQPGGGAPAFGPGGAVPGVGQAVAIGDQPLAPRAAIAPAAHADLWSRMRAGFSMPELDSPLVAQKERFYLSKPDNLRRMFERGGKYLYYIVDELEKRGMPTELALLPFVESAMNPRALSPAQAAGLWQFIPGTGKQYNLAQNWWVDNRRDVVHSTQAAIEYLQKIYAMQGNDWFLALASYNWGEGAVQRAMRKNAAAGRPTDYLSLTMPEETRHYVPKLIALRNIVMRADELGLRLPPLPNQPYFVTIEKTRPIDLKLAARFAGMTVDEFVALNPAHNRPVIAASKNNQIKLPIDRIDAFLDAVERHGEAAKPFASWQPYTLKPGESLENVAQRGGVSAHEIKIANGLQPVGRVLPGTRILAPQPDATDETQVESFAGPRLYEAIDKPPVYHTVGKKENVDTVAQRYGVTATAIRAWNNVKAAVKRGVRLLVRPAATQTILTTETGERQVVATATHAPAPAAVAPDSEAADRPTERGANRADERTAGRASDPGERGGRSTDRRSERGSDRGSDTQAERSGDRGGITRAGLSLVGRGVGDARVIHASEVATKSAGGSRAASEIRLVGSAAVADRKPAGARPASAGAGARPAAVGAGARPAAVGAGARPAVAAPAPATAGRKPSGTAPKPVTASRPSQRSETVTARPAPKKAAHQAGEARQDHKRPKGA